jgi:hypothetical protein
VLASVLLCGLIKLTEMLVILQLYAVIYDKGSKAKVALRQSADRLQPSPGLLVPYFYNCNSNIRI